MSLVALIVFHVGQCSSVDSYDTWNPFSYLRMLWAVEGSPFTKMFGNLSTHVAEHRHTCMSIMLMGASSVLGTLIGGRDLGKRALLGSRFISAITHPDRHRRHYMHGYIHPPHITPQGYGHVHAPMYASPVHTHHRPIANAPRTHRFLFSSILSG